MQDKDSLIEKLAAANKLAAAASSTALPTTPANIPSVRATEKTDSPVAKNGTAAPTPPSFLTKEGASSLFGVSSRQADAAVIPQAQTLSSPVVSSATAVTAAPPTIAPSPSHDDLLREIQKIELLSEKPSIVTESAPITLQKQAVKEPGVVPTWRSWLWPVAVAFAGIACISMLPKHVDLPLEAPNVAVSPATVQARATQIAIDNEAKQTAAAPAIASTGSVSGAITPVVDAKPDPDVAKVAAVPTEFVVRPTVAPQKVQVKSSASDAVAAKRQAELAIASAKQSVPARAAPVNRPVRQGSGDTHASAGHSDLPRVPVVAVAAPVAAAVPMVVPKAAIAKGPDQCAGLTGMVGEQCRKCSDFSFIRRLSCEGQIRVKYCDGREGMTNDCPPVFNRH